MRRYPELHSAFRRIHLHLPRAHLRSVFALRGSESGLSLGETLFAAPAIQPTERALGPQITRSRARPGCVVLSFSGRTDRPDPSQSARLAAVIDSPHRSIAR